ncbi:glycine--tRNA ligase subunit beta [Marinivivus vitaminiproducens]|uniref:glycine--tRNA ligase subunit beta n=1 Tax=Marinivivus vitaminiproducens TaxID=3035935 RepID=UPI0027A51F8A|nr:glycine--tRNA ligase subunit beta [Geminicoccaceae bacterium SCSIO 64248]
MTDLLLELFSEEIPARMQRQAETALAGLIEASFQDAGLTGGEVRTASTPRRLTLRVAHLPERQPDVEIERRGPRTDAPQAAIDGFLGSLGDVDVQLTEKAEKKGTFLLARFTKPGRATADLLAEMIPDILGRFPWPKSMRWGDNEVRWVRPLRSILCLFGGEVVPFRFGPVESGRITWGHRFMAPEPIEVTAFEDYRDRLRAAKVMLDADERRDTILRAARDLAAGEGLTLEDDLALFDEVAGLVEWPAPLIGRIDERFMDLPAEVLVTSMREHQKYLALRNPDGSLAPRFIVVANLEARDGGAAITAGNERVLRARLWDAAFFWQQDRKTSLADRRPALDAIVFHAKLGSVGERIARMEELAASLADLVPGADPAAARRAASLAKSDLVTGMVGEFPELQGLMGRYYALASGEPPSVADAIAQHYAPKGPSDACPTEPVSVVVALADKLDALAGFFAIEERPTGTKDPFALRRAALGIIRLVLENSLRLKLRRAIGRAVDAYGERFDASVRERVPAEVTSFMADRLKVHLRERGIRHDLVSAAFAVGQDDDFVRLIARIEALQAFLATDDGANLLTAYRRAGNIVRIETKRDGRPYDELPSAERLAEPAERELFTSLEQAEHAIAAALADEDYGRAMAALARLRGPLDAFFDSVRVNVEDEALRANRLCLLNRIRSALGAIADFDLIEDTALREEARSS